MCFVFPHCHVWLPEGVSCLISPSNKAGIFIPKGRPGNDEMPRSFPGRSATSLENPISLMWDIPIGLISDFIPHPIRGVQGFIKNMTRGGGFRHKPWELQDYDYNPLPDAKRKEGVWECGTWWCRRHALTDCEIHLPWSSPGIGELVEMQNPLFTKTQSGKTGGSS